MSVTVAAIPLSPERKRELAAAKLRYLANKIEKGDVDITRFAWESNGARALEAQHRNTFSLSIGLDTRDGFAHEFGQCGGGAS